MDQEWLDVLNARRDSYTFLARMYRQEVSLALLQEWVHRPELWSQEDSEAGHAMIGRFIRGLDGRGLEAAQVDLAADFASLFLNAGSSPVYPYESVYTSEEHLLMQKARDEFVAELRAEGLTRSESLNEPEDHIAFELEFMAHLCLKTIRALEKEDTKPARECLDKQRKILDEHLLVWIPTFCDDTLRAARTDFYKGIAQLTKDFVTSERATLHELSRQLSQQDARF